jgi:hypothetical protein
MSASEETEAETDQLIYSVIRRRVTDAQISLILEDLISLPGNKSFEVAVGRLMKLEKKFEQDRG